MDSKRRRLLSSAGPSTSASAVRRLRESLLREFREKEAYLDDGSDASVKKFLQSAEDVPTLFGQLVQEVSMGSHQIHVAHPAAVLWHFCSLSADYATMLRECNNGVNKIAVWCDDVVSGNVLRPDTSNKIVCVFWTSLSWPAHVRDLSFGWLPLVTVPADIVSTFAGGHSELMRHLWHVLFTASGNLRDGVDVGGSLFKGEPSAVLADEAALKAVFAVKGASGTLCCARCQNIVTSDKRRLRGQDFFRHYSDALPAEFVEHTDGRIIFQSCDELHDAARAGAPRARIREQEQEHGRNYTPSGIMFDSALRARGLWRPSSFLYYDYMHVYLASGGLIQILLNCYVVKIIRETPLELAHLDDFTQSLFAGIKNHRWRRLASNFWQQRTQTDNPDVAKHLKCFAWEAGVAVKILVRLGETALVPENLMAEEHNLLVCASEILQGLHRADSFGEDINLVDLSSRIHMFHTECTRLYGFAKIKSHLQHHIPSCIRQHGVVLSCFNCEARARFVKQAAFHESRSPGQVKGRLTLQRVLLQQEQDLANFELGPSILHKRRADEYVDLLPPDPKPSGCWYGVALRRPSGSIRSLQFAFVIFPSGERGLGQILGFIQPLFPFGSSRGLIFAIVQAMRQEGPRYKHVQEDVFCIPHSHVDKAEAVSADGDGVAIL